MLEATIEELRSAALASDDASGHFPAMYARFTMRLDEAASTGRFGDAELMRRFARRFADYYLAPHRGDRPLPGSWAASQAVAGDGRLLVVQHLLLGINAHVNHDLPQVVVDVAEDRPLEELRPGYVAVNDVLASSMPEIVRDVGRVAEWMALAVARGGGWLFNFSLRVARDVAWVNAVGLHGSPPPERARRIAELDQLVCVLAYLVTKPPWPMSWARPVLRRVEPRDPRAVTHALLGPLA